MTPKDIAEKNKRLCDGCTKCCEHVAIEIDEPVDADDFNDIIWYVLHENTIVFVDEEDDWYLEFRAKCTALGEDGLCGVYDVRPDICRDYNQEECEKDDSPYQHVFRKREDVLAYMKEHTDVKESDLYK